MDYQQQVEGSPQFSFEGFIDAQQQSEQTGEEVGGKTSFQT